MVAKRSDADRHRNAAWVAAVSDAIRELEKFKARLARKRPKPKPEQLVVEMCLYWESWRSARGDFAVALFAWAHENGLEFRGGEAGALRAFARLVLDLEPRRASEFAKVMARVLDKAVPGQAAAQIKKDGKPWLMARRLRTRDKPPMRPAGKRKARALKDRPIFIEKGGAGFIERAGRDAGSPCRAAALYDDLRRLLRRQASGVELTTAEGKHLQKSLTAWNEIQCPDRVCKSAKCEYAKGGKWLTKLGHRSLYDLVEQRVS